MMQYPSCFNSNMQLDTNCNTLSTITTFSYNYLGVYNIDGIQYMKNLETL